MSTIITHRQFPHYHKYTMDPVSYTHLTLPTNSRV